jgi:hypothetical protein
LSSEHAEGVEPVAPGFADQCLTTWLCVQKIREQEDEPGGNL